MRQALEDSLRRLNTDYIDIYIIHYRDGVTPIEEVVGEMENLKQQGKIRYFGLSNIHEDTMEELLPYRGKFVSCQNEFSLACRKFENDLKLVQQKLEAAPMTWGSLGQGILTGKTVASCAIRYILDYLPGSVVLAGVKRPAQLFSNLEAMGWTMSSEEIDQLNLISK